MYSITYLGYVAGLFIRVGMVTTYLMQTWLSLASRHPYLLSGFDEQYFQEETMTSRLFWTLYFWLYLRWIMYSYDLSVQRLVTTFNEMEARIVEGWVDGRWTRKQQSASHMVAYPA
jgi:hypothetical protein